MLVSTLLLWAGCMVSFLSSSHQQLLSKPLPKSLGWSLFALLAVTGWQLNLELYGALSAFLIVICNIMMMWVVIVLAHAHCKKHLPTFATTGSILTLSVALLGGVHVG